MSTVVKNILDFKHRTGVALKSCQNKQWVDYTWLEYYEQVKRLAHALNQVGIKKNSKVGIFSNTRHEWAVVDLAALSLGAIAVPVYPNITTEELIHIISNSEIEVLFLENRSLYKQWQLCKASCPQVKEIVSFESVNLENYEGKTLTEFIEVHLYDEHLWEKEFAQFCEAVQPDHIATIIYTSGTTGKPKGVVLRHEQIVSEVDETFATAKATKADTTLSFLPYSHVMGRIELWGHAYHGFTMAFAESIDRVKYNLLDVKPTIIVAVPRIFEKVYAAIYAQIETSSIGAKIFPWALMIGKQISQHIINKTQPSFFLVAQYQLATTLIFSKVKNAFGGNLRFAVSGGAPLAKEIGEFFHASGIQILEGYGLTETSAAVFLNAPDDYEFGTVGKPVGEVQFKFDIDGEILIKSKKVMKEYYKDIEATREVLNEEGWFRTGDIGALTEKGNLKITDRKKDLIKTAGGKYIAPQKIEGLLKQQIFISQAHIHGEKRKYVTALITLNKDYIFKYAEDLQIKSQDLSDLKNNPKIKELIRHGIMAVNQQLASFESIKKYEVLDHDFSIESGELTPSLKLKRKFIDQKYKDILDKLYD